MRTAAKYVQGCAHTSHLQHCVVGWGSENSCFEVLAMSNSQLTLGVYYVACPCNAHTHSCVVTCYSSSAIPCLSRTSSGALSPPTTPRSPCTVHTHLCCHLLLFFHPPTAPLFPHSSHSNTLPPLSSPV